MSIRHLQSQSYVRMPWKNGRGSTDEICLLPPGASRDAFDLRISRASIPEAGLFSAFPGVQRTITVVEGTGLALDFGDRVAALAPRQPFTFDSGLTPVGKPADAAVRVLNVMASRAVWRLAPAAASADAVALTAALSVVFAIDGRWTVEAGQDQVTVLPGDTALVDAPGRLAPLSLGAALVVPLLPV